MKKSLKTRISAAVAGIAIAGTALVAGAAPAHAVNTWKYTYAFDGYGRCVAFAWLDYSWAEEVFQGKKDGPVFSHYMSSGWCR